VLVLVIVTRNRFVSPTRAPPMALPPITALPVRLPFVLVLVLVLVIVTRNRFVSATRASPVAPLPITALPVQLPLLLVRERERGARARELRARVQMRGG
ncbi:MAG: hypothetical protein ACYC1V_27310, partial [Pirellulaceae bacterium]